MFSPVVSLSTSRIFSKSTRSVCPRDRRQYPYKALNTREAIRLTSIAGKLCRNLLRKGGYRTSLSSTNINAVPKRQQKVIRSIALALGNSSLAKERFATSGIIALPAKAMVISRVSGRCILNPDRPTSQLSGHKPGTMPSTSASPP